MKRENSKDKPKQFLEKPQYPGGKKALNEFLQAHLQYPEDAMEQHIEGTVRVSYMVTDDGDVIQAKVVKGLSPSCDAEALRIVNMLKYGKARNRGVRLKSNCSANINFKLSPAPLQPTLNITYSTTPKAKEPQKQKPASSYSWTITIKK